MASKKNTPGTPSALYRPLSINLPNTSTPLLSIGMIFKNESRSLERCLKALAPLRAAISCELVMADTGSTDNSRQIAAKYADILFDFPWVDDFSVARNAVMDRCSGKWFLTIDADEYLDPDFSQLISFLKNSASYDFATIVQRNYTTPSMEQDAYSDYYALRLLRMSTNQRYQGRIHEAWPMDDASKITELSRVVLHHDGYAGEEISDKKSRRNLPLLEQELEQNPESIRLVLLCIRSAYTKQQARKYARLAAELVKKRRIGWDSFGPMALRDAIISGIQYHFAETGLWIDLANTLCSQSPFTYVDIAFQSAKFYKKLGDPARCLLELHRYQDGLKRWQKNHSKQMINVLGGIDTDTPSHQQQAYLMEAECHAELGQWESVLHTLHQLQNFPNVALDLSAISKTLDLWQKDNAALSPLLQELSIICAADDNLSRILSVLKSKDTAQIERLLSAIEDWCNIPSVVLYHGLSQGSSIPDGFFEIPSETIESNAKTLVSLWGEQAEQMISHLSQSIETPTPNQIAWLYYLTTAALTDSEQGIEDFSRLYDLFLQWTSAYMDALYNSATLTENHIHLLPPTLRFGWYCLQAQDALEKGDPVGYVRYLKAGLKSSPAMKDLIKFLLSRAEEKPQKQEAVNTELLALAEQIRIILSAYPPNDPEVLALKASPVYQQVAYLIEG